MNTSGPTPQLYDGYSYWVVRMGRMMRQHMTRMLVKHDLNERILGVLMSIEGSNLDTPSAIADYMDVDRSVIARTLREMEQRNLIAVRQDGADGRLRKICLTDSGRELLVLGAQCAALTNEYFSAKLPEGMAEEIRHNFRHIVESDQSGSAGRPLLKE